MLRFNALVHLFIMLYLTAQLLPVLLKLTLTVRNIKIALQLIISKSHSSVDGKISVKTFQIKQSAIGGVKALSLKNYRSGDL